MRNPSSAKEHDRVARSVPDIEQIVGSRADNLGSYVIKSIVDGEYVPLGDHHAIEADFGNIDALTSDDLQTRFEEYKTELNTDPRRAMLREALGKVPEEARLAFEAAMFATATAKQFFNETLADQKKRDAEGWRLLDPSRDDTYHLKSLSATSDDGVCAEYSLVAGEVMNKLGEKVQYTVGFRQDWADEPSIYHAFLSNDDTSIIIDPYALAQTWDSKYPQGLVMAEAGQTIMRDTENRVIYKDVFGRAVTYSAVP